MEHFQSVLRTIFLQVFRSEIGKNVTERMLMILVQYFAPLFWRETGQLMHLLIAGAGHKPPLLNTEH